MITPSNPVSGNVATGGVISSVTPGSLGDRAGLRSGDCLVAINGHPVRDIIDVQFLSADSRLKLTIHRQSVTFQVSVTRNAGDTLGLRFDEPLFDGLRRCDNHCLFCFIGQMPAGLRPSLYVFDDDYRLSFLHGTFVTLTNLNQTDWRRLEDQRLSPLYVSVHATEPALRERLLGRRGLEPIMEQLQRLADMGIVVHAQIVVIPGVNDEHVLAQTVGELSLLYPHVASIGVVPVGLTRLHRKGIRRNTEGEARRVLDQLQGWQQHFRKECGRGLVYAADEWFLLAGCDVPDEAYYDDFPQLENGLGLVRLLIKDWGDWKRRSHAVRGNEWVHAPVVCVSGTLARPVLDPLVVQFSRITGVPVHLVAIDNRLFGEQVTVAGLLPAADVLRVVCDLSMSRLVLPRSMFDADGRVTLDGWSVKEIQEKVGVPLILTDTMSELAHQLLTNEGCGRSGRVPAFGEGRRLRARQRLRVKKPHLTSK